MVWMPGEERLGFLAKKVSFTTEIASEKGVTVSHSKAPIARGWYLA